MGGQMPGFVGTTGCGRRLLRSASCCSRRGVRLRCGGDLTREASVDADGRQSDERRGVGEPQVVREDCGWEEVEKLVDVLSDQLRELEIDIVLGITRGGMVPAVLICEQLQLRNLMSATVIFYTDSGSRFYGIAQPRFLYFPEERLIEGRRVLIVDDVWDSGYTARAVRDRVYRAGGSAKVAVLHFKPLRNEFNDAPDFYAKTTDNWIHYPWEPRIEE